MANITKHSIIIRGSKFIEEFNIFAISQGKEWRPTIKAMNAFTKEEWKKFNEWVDFRKNVTYEEVVEWKFDEEDVKYFFPYEYWIRRAEIIEESGDFFITFRDAIKSSKDNEEGFVEKWYCGICHGTPPSNADWGVRIDCCDHGCDHEEH